MQRIRMKPDAIPTPIETDTGQVLGTFLPGLGYWVTPENGGAVERVLAAGMADYEEASDAPFDSKGSLKLFAAEGQLAGFLEVKD